MNFDADNSFSVGVWFFVFGGLLRMFSQPLSEGFFGRVASNNIHTWSGHTGIAQISLLLMFFGGLLVVVAFWKGDVQ